MKEFLIKHGFELKQYPDGRYWVLFTDDDIYQCTEDFRTFCSMIDGYVHYYAPEEFKEMFEELDKA